MSQKDILLFRGLQIVSWIIFVGLCIEAGGLIVNFFFSLYRPEFVSKLYQKLDLSDMYARSRWAFFGMYSFILAIALSKAYLFYVVIKLVHGLNLSKPFSIKVSKQITDISYYTFFIGILSFIARQTAKNLMHHGYVVDKLEQFWADSEAYILMAAIVYIIAAIFRKGLEIQNENDLTV